MTPSLSDRPIAVLIPAAGHGQRFGSATNKLHAILGGKPIWQHAIESFLDARRVAKIVIALSGDDFESIGVAASQLSPIVEVVRGGATRLDSVRAMVEHLATIDDGEIAWVAVHDAARPLLVREDRDAVFDAAIQTGGAFLGIPITSSIHRRVGSTTVSVPRDELFAAATPQVFARDIFAAAYERHRGRVATDDVALVQRIGVDVKVVVGRADNLKITYPEDLVIAEAILANR